MCRLEATVQPHEETALDREQAEALHNEIDRLPRSFRLPVVLCYFEGLTLDEAAQRLRWPAGTVGSRLARARDKLRRGLTRRGMVLSTAALAAALNPKSASARIASHLCDTTTRTAMKFVAGHTARGRRGSGSGGAPIHVGPQAEIHRAGLAGTRRPRNRRGVFGPLPGDVER